MPEEVGIRELRNSASALIRRVEAGETIVVTRHGKPVAQVIPASTPAAIARGMAEGWITWSGRRARMPEAEPLIGEGPLASDYVSEGRR